MKFDKEHKVKIGALSEVEAGVFLNFLLLERMRHQATAEMCGAWIEFWHSEFQRQLGEIQKIDKGIKQVKEKFRRRR